MTEAVLDTSAVLALIKEEAGGDTVRPLVAVSFISAVNFSECVAKMVDWNSADPQRAHSVLHLLDLTVIPFDIDLARRAGELRAETRKAGLSFADRACLALAEREGLPAVTADQRWAGVDIGVEVRLIR